MNTAQRWQQLDPMMVHRHDRELVPFTRIIVRKISRDDRIIKKTIHRPACCMCGFISVCFLMSDEMSVDDTTAKAIFVQWVII